MMLFGELYLPKPPGEGLRSHALFPKGKTEADGKLGSRMADKGGTE